jgi:hypothetical protein
MTMTTEELKAALKHFNGTDEWFRHSLYRFFTYTEGIQYLAVEAGAYWLVDLIFGLQYEASAVKAEPFQCWTLTVKGSEATLICEDGNGNKVYTKAIEFTDFPMEKITIWFADSVLMLPSEY